MPEALVLQEGAVSLLLLTENMLTEVFFKSHQGKEHGCRVCESEFKMVKLFALSGNFLLMIPCTTEVQLLL